MAACPHNLSSLNCELRIIRAKNLDFITSGTLFVRYYLLTGKNQRIQLNSREIRSTSDPCWNESISLECSGDEQALDELKHQTVVFELRWRRNSSTILGKISGSKLLGRGEVSWMEVLESKDLFIEKWVSTVSKNDRLFEGLKPPALQIGMKIVVNRSMDNRKTRRSSKWNECGCRDGGCNGRDEDIFALAAAINGDVLGL